ncbi:MAG: mechanosensitive ion channel family protein [Anaerolineae bacterium]|nr:mechanosensitive ion channel family protein [Anaerolineae bacterium]
MDIDLVGPLQVLLTDFIVFLPRLVVAIIVFLATLLVAGPIARAAKRAASLKISNDDTVLLLSRLVKWTIIVVGLILALDQVNFDITGFVAGLGIAGLTIGFALQDVARNFVAGILIFLRQPFQIGEAVKIAGYSGSVEEITTRDTMLRTWDGERVILPNTDVLENPIVNYTAIAQRRRTVYIGLGYGQDTDKAMATFAEAIKRVPGVMAEPAPTVYAEELGDSGIILAARFWVDIESNNVFQVHSDVVVAINATADSEGIELPYPIQTVRVVETV